MEKMSKEELIEMIKELERKVKDLEEENSRYLFYLRGYGQN